MYPLILTSGAALLLSLALTPVLRSLCLRLDLVDRPDNQRKLHARAVPRAGGVAVILAYALSFGILWLTPLRASLSQDRHLDNILRVLPPVGFLFLVGVLDDLIQLRPWQKLAGQMLAAIAACAAGVRIEQVASSTLPYWLGAPVTVLWLVACSNALNLIDGLDGLASGIGLFAALTMLLAALIHNDVALALATAPLACALAGFLRYNFNPASIFLGDSGSLTIGFLLGIMGVLWTQKAATMLGITAPVMALAVPILDTGLAILRRFLRRQPIFSADRGHIHHRLLDRGLTPRRAVLLLYAACAAAAALALLVANVNDGRLNGLVLVLFCGGALLGIQRLRFPEFVTASRMLAQGAFREHLNAHMRLTRVAGALAAAHHPDEYWKAVREACLQFGYRDIRLRLRGVEYRDPWPLSDHCWSLYVPLSEHGDYLQLSREFAHPGPDALAPFLDVLRQHAGGVEQGIGRSAA